MRKVAEKDDSSSATNMPTPRLPPLIIWEVPFMNSFRVLYNRGVCLHNICRHGGAGNQVRRNNRKCSDHCSTECRLETTYASQTSAPTMKPYMVASTSVGSDPPRIQKRPSPPTDCLALLRRALTASHASSWNVSTSSPVRRPAPGPCSPTVTRRRASHPTSSCSGHGTSPRTFDRIVV